jgi:uridylate kinase
MVSGGLKIGWSTDLDAVVFADVLGIDRVFKISDVEYIYSTDPKKDSNAKAIKDISWDEYFKMFGISKDTDHIPNDHIPIDAMCAQFAEKKNISIHISGGSRLENIKDIEDLFQDGSFIHP